MKVTKEELENREVSLSIEAEDGDLEPYMNRAYRHLVRRINVPGFRKGKAPRAVVERMVGEELMFNEAMEFFLPEAVEKAIEQEGVEQGGRPEVEIAQQEPSVIVKATVPLMPRVTLDAYRDIRVPQEPVEVSDDDISHILEDLRYAQAPWGPVDRAIEFGDQVTLDARGEVEENEVTDQEGVVYYVAEGSPSPAKGFSEALVGAEAGETRDFTVQIPEDFQDPELAGKDCSFRVTVHEIKAKLLPELDDEFAKGVGNGYESLDALKQQVGEDVRARKVAEGDRKYEESVMEELLNHAAIEVSPRIVEHEAEHILEDEERSLKQRRVSVDQYLALVGRSAEEHREDARKEANDRLLRAHVLNKVAELEGIGATDEEVDNEIEGMLQRTESRTTRQRRRELNTPEARNSLTALIKRRKAMRRMIGIARGENGATSEAGEETSESDPGETENAAPSE